MHEGLCLEFTILGLIGETFIIGKGIVVAIGLCVWLSCNWYFDSFTQQKLARMISKTRTLISWLR